MGSHLSATRKGKVKLNRHLKRIHRKKISFDAPIEPPNKKISEYSLHLLIMSSEFEVSVTYNTVFLTHIGPMTNNFL